VEVFWDTVYKCFLFSGTTLSDHAGQCKDEIGKRKLDSKDQLPHERYKQIFVPGCIKATAMPFYLSSAFAMK